MCFRESMTVKISFFSIFVSHWFHRFFDIYWFLTWHWMTIFFPHTLHLSSIHAYFLTDIWSNMSIPVSPCLVSCPIQEQFKFSVAAQKKKQKQKKPRQCPYNDNPLRTSPSPEKVLTGLQSATSAHIWGLSITCHQLGSACRGSVRDRYLSGLLTLSVFVLGLQQRFLSGLGTQR